MITFDKYDVDEALSHIIENDVILDSIKQQVPENVEVSIYLYFINFPDVLY